MHSSSNRYTDDMFEEISLDMAIFKNKYTGCEFIISGDMNGRTGTQPDYIIQDCSDYLPLPDEYVEDNMACNERFSEDKIVNVQGRRLLDICKMSSLRILNGRIGVDYNIGRITCVTYNGQSLVDYVLSSPSLMQSISSFDVLSQTLYSDHNPIVFSVQSSFTKLIQEEPQSVSKMCWRPDHKDNFITSLDSPEVTEKLDEVLSLLEGNNVDENNVVEKSVTSFTCALRMASDQYFFI